MDDLVHQGKVLYWGTSVWPAEKLMEAVAIADRRNLYFSQVEQPRYHMLDRHIECEIMETCRQHGIGLVVWSPLAEGLLTGKYNDGIPSGTRAEESSALQQELTDANLSKIRRLTAVAEELGLTMAQLALAWILRRPEISSVITGASRIEQVKSNVSALNFELEADVLDTIEAILDNRPPVPSG
jgi:aryl-alcohol dehydrogenase-like predicted oxidoreductase